MKEEKTERRLIQSEEQDIKLNCTLLENPGARGLCVIFPGKGYTVDKPLLYYSTRLAMASGYNLLLLSYGEFTLSERTRLTMKDLILGVIEQVMEEESFKGDLIFISKSVGALFASDTAISLENHRPVRCAYLTPIDQMVPNMARTDFISFTGTEDHLLDHEKTLAELGEASGRLHVYEGADHSLNARDINESIRILSEVLDKIGRFIR